MLELSSPTHVRFRVSRCSPPTQIFRRQTACHAAETGQKASLQQQPLDADVHLLEEAFRRPSAPSPELNQDPDVPSSWPDAVRADSRSAYIKPVLPVIRTVRATEKRLDAELPSVVHAVVLMVAIILYDMGCNNILDRMLGDSILGSVSCILVGLGTVLGVKVLGLQTKDYWRL